MTSLSPHVTLSSKVISLSSHVTHMNSLVMPLCYKVTPPELKSDSGESGYGHPKAPGNLLIVPSDIWGPQVTSFSPKVASLSPKVISMSPIIA